ncbi:LytTR family DNA-binding domain-containing protein [Brevibacillus fulvus]|uniref:HTH LytTR-type domain-containing protein n=1 Tax=Brevibacillus fulvus TaxID=1125967 RepID=A0A938Y675_9BACL|nr:LytTR family DNA-binding domain-containing protein [Brevibacillus fulvus]MBM7591985.1 hypothetical protein [Brevibacillus fulvus]
MKPFSIPSILQIMSEFFPKHTSIAVTDAKQYIYYQPSQAIDLNISPGDLIKEGTASHKALTLRQKVSETIAADVLGVPYFGTSIPLLEEGVVNGCITAILPCQPSALPFLTVRTSPDQWMPMPYAEIMYLEAQNRKTQVVTLKGKGFHKSPLSELEWLLPDELFIRVHRSYIVNPHYIAEIHPDYHSTFLLVMKDQQRIPVSQSYSSQFRKLLQF